MRPHQFDGDVFMDYKTILGIAALVIDIPSYVLYFRDIYFRNTRPHVFSWFVWSLLTGIAFFAQISKGAGVGAWVTGLTSVLCLLIAVIALFRGEKIITKVDWISFVAAFFGIILWVFTDSPLAAVIVVSIVDLLGFVPTFRKSYHRPFQESPWPFGLGSLKFGISLFALESFNLTTALYPATLVISNGIFVIMLLIRRQRSINLS